MKNYQLLAEERLMREQFCDVCGGRTFIVPEKSQSEMRWGRVHVCTGCRETVATTELIRVSDAIVQLGMPWS